MKKRLTAFALAFVLLLCSGCGKDSGSSQANKVPEESTEESKSAFAYQATYLPLNFGDSQVQYINGTCLSGDTMFMLASCRTGTTVYTNEITGEPVLDENGNTQEMPVYESCVFSMDLQTQSITRIPFETQPLEDGVFGDSNFGSLYADSLGGFWVMEQVYRYHFDLPEDFDSTTGDYYQYYVDDGTQLLCHHFDAQGNLDKTVTLDAPENTYLGNVSFLSDGSIYATDWMNIYRFDENRAIMGNITVENGINMLYPYSDTQMGVNVWTENGNMLQPIDAAAMTLGEGFSLPANAYQLFRGFGEYDFLYYNGDVVYGLRAGDETGEKVLSWLDSDVDSSNLTNYSFTEDGTCYALENRYDEQSEKNTYQLIRMDRVDASTLPQKQELTLACMGLDWNVRTEILEFNRSNPDVRIVVEDYSQYATEDDYYAGVTKLNTQIISGNAPDIFVVNERLPMETYAAKGILQDLWPLIDADAELSREDLMTHFFDVLSVDGKLYQVVDSFSINSVVGRTDVIGTAESWSWNELQALRQDYPESYIFGETDIREWIMESAILRNVEQFVNWTTKECSFHTETFEGLLEFVAEFPEEFNYDDFDWNDYGSEGLRMRMRRQLTCQANIGGFDMVQYYNAMCEGKANFIGYPTEEGTGSTFSCYNGLAISSTCKNLDAAWQFVRTILTEEYQTQEYMYQFPTNKHSFEAYKQQMMTPRWFETDPETGEEVEQPSNWYWFEEGDEVQIFTLTEAEYDLFMDLYEKTNVLSGGNEEISELIKEECQAFFAGEKTAKETANLIQDRVSLYVLEQG